MFSAMWCAIGAASGALAGPPLRTVIFHHSVPPNEPWRTKCPQCGTTIVPTQRNWRMRTLPVSGNCPACRTRFGPPPLTVEFVGALTLGSLAGSLGGHPATLAVAWAALVGIVLAFVDIAVHRLPDRLIAAGFVGAFVLLGPAALLGPVARLDVATAGGARRQLVTALLAGLAGGLGYLILVVLSPRNMGLGDAKLAVLIGFVTGWFGAWVMAYAFAIGALLAAISGVALLAARRVGRRQAIAYGPFMLVGALAAIVLLAP